MSLIVRKSVMRMMTVQLSNIHTLSLKHLVQFILKLYHSKEIMTVILEPNVILRNFLKIKGNVKGVTMDK